MKFRKTVTVDDILAWKPCSEWDRDRIQASFGKRKHVTPLEILAAERVPCEDRLWCLLRPEFLSKRDSQLFACDCALRALRKERKAGREPDKRSWSAVRVAEKFALGAATREELIAAWDAAWAVRDAARDAKAAWAARVAAWAARAAARDARSAAWSVSWNSGAGSAEFAWQLEQLKKYLLSATKTPGRMMQ